MNQQMFIWLFILVLGRVRHRMDFGLRTLMGEGLDKV